MDEHQQTVVILEGPNGIPFTNILYNLAGALGAAAWKTSTEQHDDVFDNCVRAMQQRSAWLHACQRTQVPLSVVHGWWHRTYLEAAVGDHPAEYGNAIRTLAQAEVLRWWSLCTVLVSVDADDAVLDRVVQNGVRPITARDHDERKFWRQNDCSVNAILRVKMAPDAWGNPLNSPRAVNAVVGAIMAALATVGIGPVPRRSGP